MPGEHSGDQGTPSYTDIGLGPASSPVTPGSPEWYRKQLGDYYGQSILLGTTSTNVGGHLSQGPGGPYERPGPDVQLHEQNSEDIYRQFISLAAVNPQQFAQMQALLFDAGFYGNTSRKNVHWGMLTDQTSSAMKNAIEAYVMASKAGTGTPITWMEFLERQAGIGRQNQEQGGVGGAGGGGGGANEPPPVVINLTDPTALKATLQQAAISALDRGLSEDELNKFVASFHALQSSTQMAAARPTADVSSVVSPDAGAAAMAEIQNQHPDEFRQHNLEAYANAAMNLFLPPGSQLANFSPTAQV